MRKIVAKFVDRELSAREDTGLDDEVDSVGAYIKTLTYAAVTCLLSEITPAFLMGMLSIESQCSYSIIGSRNYIKNLRLV